MRNDFSKLYDLVFGHILLPSELIQNAKLPNYEYVKYESFYDGLHVETCCRLEDGSKVKFHYYFDEKDRLMKLIALDKTEEKVIFDREHEIYNLRSKIKSQLSGLTLA